jgi:hypothetical protein
VPESGLNVTVENRELIGKKFGSWVVLDTYDGGQNGEFLRCQCDCGKISYLNPYHLKQGLSTRCRSCASSSHNYKTELTGPHRIYNQYKYQANRRGIEFDLTFSEVRFLIQCKCSYCGISPSQVWRSGLRIPYLYTGIDRVNNDLGYTGANVVPCCGICNHMKKDLNKEEFLSHIKRIAEHQSE